MKIAILNLYQDSASRGAETYIRELSKRLALNHQVSVLASKKYWVKRLPVLWRLFLDPKSISVALFTVSKLPYLFKNKFDLVIPVNGGWQPAIIRILTWIQRTKMVIPGFSGIGWDDRNNLWSFPDSFVPMTPFSQIWAKKVMPFVRTDYIPGGVDTRKFTPYGVKYKTKLKKPLVVCVAALTARKRIDLAIKAVSELKSVSLLVCGDGEEKGNLIDLGKKSLGKRFDLIELTYADLPPVYRAADVFTLPSWKNEAFGLVYLEAMASNVPIVATEDENRKKIIGEAGILVDPRDSDGYANALKKALESNWGNKPRLQAEKYSWEEITKMYEKLFEDVTARK
jgi:glycosyltransferase involved in cell wall biosynthesis